MNEIEAIARLKRGDVRGLEVLVRTYQLDAVRIANSITKDLGLAEEIVQEAFLRVYRCIDQFDDTRPFRAWLLRIVVNDALKALSSQNRFQSLEDDPEMDENDFDAVLFKNHLWFEQEEFTSTHDNAAALQEILNNLPPKYRAVLELKYYLDMSEEEIAMTVSIPLGTVKSRLHAAKQRFRSILERLDSSITCE